MRARSDTGFCDRGGGAGGGGAGIRILVVGYIYLVVLISCSMHFSGILEHPPSFRELVFTKFVFSFLVSFDPHRVFLDHRMLDIFC